MGSIDIQWPSISPYLNLIENMSKLFKLNLAKRHLRTYKSLVSDIKKEWSAFQKQSLAQQIWYKV